MAVLTTKGWVDMRIRAAVTVLAMLGLVVVTTAPASAYKGYGGSFSDDDGTSHEPNVEAIRAVDITDGCGGTRYCPDDHVTRGQMAKFLFRAFPVPSADEDYFTDDDGSVFEDAINSIAAFNITSGCNPPDNDRYCPDEYVTRGQMAKFIVAATPGGPTPAAEDYFLDDEGSIFENAIDELRNLGITSGCNPPANDHYCPDDNVTRAQMATFLKKASRAPTQPDPTPFGNSTCDRAYSPCVPTLEEVGDLDCPDIRAVYPEGVLNDLTFGDPHRLNADRDGRGCETTGG